MRKKKRRQCKICAGRGGSCGSTGSKDARKLSAVKRRGCRAEGLIRLSGGKDHQILSEEFIDVADAIGSAPADIGPGSGYACIMLARVSGTADC